MVLADATIAVTGISGFFLIVAAVLFLVAAIVAWLIPPRAYWAASIAAGLLALVLASLIH
jgi:hypothetical protein